MTLFSLETLELKIGNENWECVKETVTRPKSRKQHRATNCSTQ